MSRTLVALHGLLGTPALFDVLGAKLRNHRLQALVLPGHGPSPAPVVGFAETVDAIAAQLRGRAPFDLVGYSLGGRLSLALLARHPELVRRAVIVSAHPGLSNDVERAARRAEDEAQAELIERDGLSAFVDAWEKKPLFASQARLARHLLVQQRAARLSHTSAGIAASLRLHGLGVMDSFAPTIATNASRLALLVGELDDKFVGLAREQRVLAPALAVETIAAAGHNPLLEEPLATVARIEALLADDEPAIPRPHVAADPQFKWQGQLTTQVPPKENS